MNSNFYSNERLVNIRHAERIAEANAYRLAKQAEQSEQDNASPQPAKAVTAPCAFLGARGELGAGGVSGGTPCQ